MGELKRHIEAVSNMQNRNRMIHEEYDERKEITIQMFKSTFFFVILTQMIIVSLFFVLGFIVAWNYFSQTTPASFARTNASQNTQIIQDIDELNSGHGLPPQ